MDAVQRKIPFSVEAEQSVLGSVLIDPKCYDDVAQIIGADDFYIEEHKDIFAIMHQFNLSGKDIDLVALINELVVKGIYPDEVAARNYIRIIADVVPGSANAKDYAKIVHDKSILRKLIDVTEDIQEKVYTEGENVSHIVDYAEQRIYDVAGNNERTDFQHIKDVIFDIYDRLNVLKDGATEADLDAIAEEKAEKSRRDNEERAAKNAEEEARREAEAKAAEEMNGTNGDDANGTSSDNSNSGFGNDQNGWNF